MLKILCSWLFFTQELALLRENLCQNPVFVGDIGYVPPDVAPSIRALRLPRHDTQLPTIRAIVAANANQNPKHRHFKNEASAE